MLEYKQELNMCVWMCACIFYKKVRLSKNFFQDERHFEKKKTEKKFPIFTSIVILIKILISIHFIPFLEIRFILNVMAFVFSLFRYPQLSALRTSCFLCVCVFLVCVYASIIQCVFFNFSSIYSSVSMSMCPLLVLFYFVCL